jgi:hypothetical protein
MVSSKNANAFAGMTRNEYRPIYKKEHAAFLKGRTGKDIEGIYDVVFAPRLVDMKKIRERTAKEVSERIERLYANDGR